MQDPCQPVGADGHRRNHAIPVLGISRVVLLATYAGDHENGQQSQGVAGLVEVLQVERVVPDLVRILPRKGTGADLELDDEDHVVDHRDCIDALAQAGNDKLEVEMPSPGEIGQCAAQNFQLVQPRVALGWLDAELACSGQFSGGLVRMALRSKRLCACGGSGWHAGAPVFVKSTIAHLSGSGRTADRRTLLSAPAPDRRIPLLRPRAAASGRGSRWNSGANSCWK